MVHKYKWFSVGDLNASSTMIFDNLTNMAIISFLLSVIFKFPESFILTHIIPGIASGVILSNLAAIWYAFRLAKKLNRDDITAFPIGTDAPTCIGFTLAVTGPAFLMFKDAEMSINDAALNAWHVSCACIFIIGVVKLICSFFAERLVKYVPTVALLGALAGVSVGLIAFFPLLSMMQLPFLSMFVLAVICMVYFAGYKIPFNLPGVLVAVLIATGIYYACQQVTLGHVELPALNSISHSFPHIASDLFVVMPQSIKFLSIALPFAFLVIFGSISVIESAKVDGTNYSTKNIMLIDSISTIVMALFGGTSQTTPYAGFPAYKKMDARVGYIFLNAIVIGLGALLGVIGYVVNLTPSSIFAPVLLYVGIEISMQVFIVSDKKYYPAAILGIFPSIAHMLQIKITDPNIVNLDKLSAGLYDVVSGKLTDTMAIVILGNGFIVTGVLWAAVTYYMIERNIKGILFSCAILSLFSLFGIIHSINLDGSMYWLLDLPKSHQIIPIELAVGYLLFGVTAGVLHWINHGKTVDTNGYL